MFGRRRLAALCRRVGSRERCCAYLSEPGPAGGARAFSERNSLGEVRALLQRRLSRRRLAEHPLLQRRRAHCKSVVTLRLQPSVTGEWNFASATDVLFSRVRTGEAELGCVTSHCSQELLDRNSVFRSAGWHAWQLFVACLPVTGKLLTRSPPAALRTALSVRLHPGAYFMLKPTRERRLQREQARRTRYASVRSKLAQSR